MNFNDSTIVFGNNLLTLINQKSWSIQYTAHQLKYGRNDLSCIINGTKNFRLCTAVRFAKFFNVSLFLMFSRQFDNTAYRSRFPFVDTDYMDVFRHNFQSQNVKQSVIELDSSTVSKIMRGYRNNLTIKTLYTISSDASIPLSELLKTTQDKEIEFQEVTL